MRDDTTRIPKGPLHEDVVTMAVRMILTREVSRAQLARDFGVGMPTLSRWVRDAFDQSPYGDVLQSLHEEVGLLRKENAALKKMLSARNARAAPGMTDPSKPN